MPPRPTLPADDLYARLGVPLDASPEAIELAWRGLLRRHHPDIAGPEANELAKRINVAHDWLSDPELRRRYDREHAPPGRRGSRSGAGGVRDGAGWTPRATPRRPPTMAERVAAVVERVDRLTIDDLDRLGLAEPAPIAFLATLRRFVTVELQATLDDAERAAMERLPPAARRRSPIRDAITGKLADLVLGEALDELLGEPAGDRARERLTRGWDAAVGQPRYGPGSAAVEELLERLAAFGPDEVRALAGTGTRERLGETPWPAGVSPEEDDALRVSSELASRDAAAAVARAAGPGAAVAPGARRAAARIAHLLVLRHAIHAAEFERLARPWLGDLIPRRAPWGARVRQRR
jgi:curved DNA-binding protein CbpA